MGNHLIASSGESATPIAPGKGDDCGEPWFGDPGKLHNARHNDVHTTVERAASFHHAMLEVVEVHVRAKFHEAKCSGS